MMRRFIAATLILCLFCTTQVFAEVDYESDYEIALMMAGNDLTNVQQISEAAELLQQLGGYKLSKNYVQYFRALLDILPDESDMRTARIRIETCGRNPKFVEDLALRGFASCEEILAYMDARELQTAEEYGSAYEAYAELTILDAADRAVEMMLLIDSTTPFVSVVYQTEDGTVLKQELVEIPLGSEKTIQAREFDGYQLIDDCQNSVLVTVDELGRQSLSKLTFVYCVTPKTAIIHVVYKTDKGVIIDQENIEVKGGTSIEIHAKIIDGYTFLYDGSEERVTVIVDKEGYASQKEVCFIYRRVEKTSYATSPPATPIPLPIYSISSTSNRISVTDKSYDVYTGPGTEYFRANNGRASVSDEYYRYIGKVGNWAFVRCNISKGKRYGYIYIKGENSALNTLRNLEFSSAKATISQDTYLWDNDEDWDLGPLCELSRGTEVTYLCQIRTEENTYAYIETKCDGKKVRGFVRLDCIK